MAITSGQQTISATAQLVDGISPNPSRLHIHNMDNTKVIYLGNGSVTVANGLGLQKLDSIELTLNPGESLYAISDGGNHLISWLRQTQY
jgi:plastocyanin domain-containing protein